MMNSRAENHNIAQIRLTNWYSEHADTNQPYTIWNRNQIFVSGENQNEISNPVS